ncbi:RNB domain protein, partial [Chlamydia psittaci 06-1683]
IDSSSTPCL